MTREEADIAISVAAEQIAYWRASGVTALVASAGIGMLPTSKWRYVESALVRKWFRAIGMVAAREEIRRAA